ncbi:hypothetical protein ABG768_018477 [Culter alburnus]|uniref:Uncharacterized protein n=2 Tax=Culter alburnus TaxID=194366 RepID=A0AAW1YVT5_CULAL
MGHARADDLKLAFEKGTEALPKKNMLQISMDGPNVNWSFYKKVEQSLADEYGLNLLNLGSCGLHIVNGAFQKGLSSTGWRIDGFLRAIYQLLHDCPARREEYLKVTETQDGLLPLSFCPTRWVENTPVLERALQILPNLATYVSAVGGKRTPNPDTKSFDEVCQSLKNPLLEAQINFALSVSKSVTPFLTKYQTDKPMVPFLAADLHKMLKNLMCRFIKPEVMQEAKSVKKLLDVDIKLPTNYIDCSSVDLGYVTNRILKELRAKQKVGASTIMDFRRSCRDGLVAMVDKLQQKSPLKYILVKNMGFLDPVNMANEETDQLKGMLRRTLAYLVDQGRINEQDCDEIIQQYAHFLDDVVQKNHSAFADFNSLSDRVDTLLYTCMSKEKELQKLWKMCRQLLLLSHGQGTVERGFSVNRKIEVENLVEDTYRAQRMIVDHLRIVGGIENVAVDKELLLSVSCARQRYIASLEEKKKKEETQAKNQKRKALFEEIEELQSKKKRLESDMKALVESADKYALKAESTGQVTLIAKSNSLRHGAKEKKVELEKLEKQLSEKQLHFKSK